MVKIPHFTPRCSSDVLPVGGSLIPFISTFHFGLPTNKERVVESVYSDRIKVIQSEIIKLNATSEHSSRMRAA